MLSEPGHYDFMPWRRRPRISWPNGARIAFWVAPNIEHYELDPPPNARRMPWTRPQPDVLGYSWRDYGNRVGFWRMADVMARHGVRGSVSLNVAVCDHYPEIIERCCELGWELFSHGTYNTRYFYGMNEEQQRAVIRENRETIKRASGQELDGWLTPAISNDETTQHLLAEEGIKYTLDMLHDDQPTPIKVRSGNLISIPYSLEINDVPLLVMRNTPPERFAAICKALNLSPKLEYTGGNKGWIGDNPFIFLDTKKIQSTGWKPQLTIEQGIIRTLRWLEANRWVYEARK